MVNNLNICGNVSSYIVCFLNICSTSTGYGVSRYLTLDELKEIVSQWNHPDPDFYIGLHVSACF
jgi:hypothetical protein